MPDNSLTTTNPAQLIALSPGLTRLLNSNSASGPARFDPESGEFLGSVEAPWTPPTNLPAAVISEARGALVELDRYLEPAAPSNTLARVMALLEHYFVVDRDPRVQKGIAYDWAEDLAEFPEWAVHEAARKWRRMETKRPTPAHIRDLCLRLTREPVKQRNRLREMLRVNDKAPQPQNKVFQLPNLRRMSE
jgi:hypothetical protein